jgi:Glyoxalase-like domain
MRLDHLSYAAGPEGLAACVQRLGAKLGAGFTDGGIHPSFGTRNFILPLADGCYLEVVEALDHPAAEKAPFGRAVRDRSAEGGGWLGWVIRVSDVTVIEAKLGRSAAAGHRRRPDGFDLRWKQIGVKAVAADSSFPFFVHWLSDDAHHPSAGGSAVTLRSLDIAGDEAAVDGYVGTLSSQFLDGVTVEWLEPSDAVGTGLVAATFETSNGAVSID